MSEVKAHEFQRKQFNKPTYCDYCEGFIWGLHKQGFACEGCGYNAHPKCVKTAKTSACVPFKHKHKDKDKDKDKDNLGSYIDSLLTLPSIESSSSSSSTSINTSTSSSSTSTTSSIATSSSVSSSSIPSSTLNRFSGYHSGLSASVSSLDGDDQDDSSSFSSSPCGLTTNQVPPDNIPRSGLLEQSYLTSKDLQEQLDAAIAQQSSLSQEFKDLQLELQHLNWVFQQLCKNGFPLPT